MTTPTEREAVDLDSLCERAEDSATMLSTAVCCGRKKFCAQVERAQEAAVILTAARAAIERLRAERDELEAAAYDTLLRAEEAERAARQSMAVAANEAHEHGRTLAAADALRTALRDMASGIETEHGPGTVKANWPNVARLLTPETSAARGGGDEGE